MAACSRESVASGPGCQVERCSCGTLHVTVGAVTLKMDAAMFDAVLPTLVTAAERLGRERPFSLVGATQPRFAS
jgi:hypothetical protein